MIALTPNLLHRTIPTWVKKISKLSAAYYTFWYVIPTLPMFLLFPLLLPKLGFWLTMGACVVATIICFGLFALMMKGFGINLL